MYRKYLDDNYIGIIPGQSVIMVQGQESGSQLSYPGVNSVYDNTNYDYNYQGKCARHFIFRDMKIVESLYCALCISVSSLKE